MAGNIKKFVIDASFVLSFLLPDEANEKTTEVFLEFKEGKISFVSTTLLSFEVFNSLRSAVLSKRIDFEMLQKLIKTFTDCKISVLEIDFIETLQQSLKNQLSFYDASYLQLSKDLEVPLLTLDKKLAKLSS